MSLRLRLVAAFFLFSVVPLAAVTFYSYTNNERALRTTAQHETEMLTGELTQRMQVVTTQISERVEHLMDMPASTPAPTATSGRTRTSQATVARNAPSPKVTAPAAPAPPSIATVPVTPVSTIDPATMEGQVAGALGEVALLLNNVEVRGLGRAGGRFGGPPGSAPTGGRGGVPQTAAAAEAALRAGTIPNRPAAPAAPTPPRPDITTGRGTPGETRPAAQPGPVPPADVTPQGSGREGEASRGGRHGRFDGPPPDSHRPGAPPTPPGAAPGSPWPVAPDDAEDPTHLKIDLAPIRRELYREMAEGGALDKMTPEERQRVGREVNQRLLGIVQGLQLSAAEIQKKAEAAKQQAVASVPSLPAPPPTPATKGAAAPGVTSGTPAAAAKTVAAQPVAKPMTRKSALSGTQLNVRMERDGEVVRQVNAEINLPNLLATVFANTRRDSGEIPFAVGKDGHLYAPTDADREKLASLDVARVDDTTGTKRIDNWIVVTMPDKSGAGLRFGIARPVGNLLNELRRTTGRNAGLGLLFVAFALAGMVPLSGRLTRDLTALTAGVGRIAQGDYAARVPVKSGDEIGRLASAFNHMAADVEQHQRSAVEQERIRRELELGRRIQSEMLPRTPLHFGLTEVKGISMPAREVGGDFFNYFALDSGLVALLVGDVSGKGVGAALLMANIQASLRTRFALGQALSPIAEAIDRDIEANSPGPVYATLFIAIFDPASRRMRYVNAGHNPQFVLRREGGLEKLTSTGLPVGMLAGHGYKECEVELAPGDLLFFYTDGCVEMENESGEMFGSDRLESIVASTARASADDVLATVERAIATFRGQRDLFDDATMMAVTVG